jgi:ABC-type polysaccharide/polyol phosphate export permease
MSTTILTALMLFTFACLIPAVVIILCGEINHFDDWLIISMLPLILITISVGLILSTFNIC